MSWCLIFLGIYTGDCGDLFLENPDYNISKVNDRDLWLILMLHIIVNPADINKEH